MAEIGGDNVLMCPSANVPMLCSLRRGGAKCLALKADLKHESTILHELNHHKT